MLLFAGGADNGGDGIAFVKSMSFLNILPWNVLFGTGGGARFNLLGGLFSKSSTSVIKQLDEECLLFVFDSVSACNKSSGGVLISSS